MYDTDLGYTSEAAEAVEVGSEINNNNNNNNISMNVAKAAKRLVDLPEITLAITFRICEI